MLSKEITVNLPTNLEERPVAVLVQIASKYTSSVSIETEDKKINAKSIMGIMGMGMKNGGKITIVADGEDEKDAIEHLEKYISKGIQ